MGHHNGLMSDIPFDATEESTAMDVFRAAVEEAYTNNDDLDPLEAVSVLQSIAADIVDCILAAESEEDEEEEEV